MPLAEMPGHLVSSFLGKRRLEQDASLDPILVLGKNVPFPTFCPASWANFLPPFCLHSAHVRTD